MNRLAVGSVWQRRYPLGQKYMKCWVLFCTRQTGRHTHTRMGILSLATVRRTSARQVATWVKILRQGGPGTPQYIPYMSILSYDVTWVYFNQVIVDIQAISLSLIGNIRHFHKSLLTICCQLALYSSVIARGLFTKTHFWIIICWFWMDNLLSKYWNRWATDVTFQKVQGMHKAVMKSLKSIN